MKHFFSLLKHELRVLFNTPTTYLSAILFLILMSSLYILILKGYTDTPQEEIPSTQFYQSFWLPALFLIPLLTMRSLAEERRLGTLETLMTTPVSFSEVILSKFASAYIYYIAIWTITLSFPLVTQFLIPETSVDKSLYDSASLIGGFSFIAISGLLYIAIGIFSSSLTRSQLLAAMITFCLLFFLIIGTKLLFIPNFLNFTFLNSINISTDYLNTFKHLEDFTQGILDSRPLFFYTSATLLTLSVTTLNLQHKTCN